MTLVQILVLVVLAVLIGQLKRGRHLAILAGSTAVIFWLQPVEPLPALGFWLPFGTIAVTLGTWVMTSEPAEREWRKSWPALAVIAAVTLAVTAYGPLVNPALVAPSRSLLALGALSLALVLAGLWRIRNAPPALMLALIVLVLVAFVFIKTPSLANAIPAWLAAVLPSGAEPAPEIDFSWLGFSYIAFRLLHTLQDRRAGRLPSVGLDRKSVV